MTLDNDELRAEEARLLAAALQELVHEYLDLTEPVPKQSIWEYIAEKLTEVAVVDSIIDRVAKAAVTTHLDDWAQELELEAHDPDRRRNVVFVTLAKAIKARSERVKRGQVKP